MAPHRVAYIISNIDKALAFEWIAASMDPAKIRLFFILLNPADSYLEQWLRDHGTEVYSIKYRNKYDLIPAIFKIFFCLAKNNIKIVHCHLFEASLIGLLAAKLAGVTKRIYTRHYADLHHTYHPHAVKYDMWINYLATDIIAPSNVVKNILIHKEKVLQEKVAVVHHGFDLDYFIHPDQVLLESLRQKYNPGRKYPVIGVIARYTQLKGIQYIIPAFGEILKTNPDALLLLANTTGDYTNHIKDFLTDIPTENYYEIVFENNVAGLYQLFDIYIHVPIAPDIEAFGQTYVEALASGIPSVYTLAGVAKEFIEDRSNALVVTYENSEAISKAIRELLADSSLAQSIAARGRSDVLDRFGLNGMIKSLERIYLSLPHD